MLSKIIEQNKPVLENTESYMLPHLNKIICLLNKLENRAGDDYFSSFKRKKLSKGEFLLHEGMVCKHIWVLETGVARIFNRQEKTEATRYFFFPGEFIDSYSSSSTGEPSEESIQVIRDSVVYAISRHRMKKLQHIYPEISEIERLTVECHIMWLQQRLYVMLQSNAIENYLHLLKCQPYLLQTVPVNHIAMYLGVSPERLSRIRRKVGVY